MRQLFHRLDPRARILTVLVATLIVASTPAALSFSFAWYLPLSLVLILTSRASGSYIASRCLAASPFILLAAGLLAFQSEIAAALSIALKGYTAALLLALLTATTPLSQLLWALRRLKAPESLNVILGMMYRYTNLLLEEHARLERARESRTVRPLGGQRFAVYGREFATLIIRSWDRADRVHAAMLSRGYDGGWPSMESRKFAHFDTAVIAVTSLLFLSARLLA